MEWADIKKMCQMKLLTFTEWQSSQDFIFTGLFIMAKSRYHAPTNRKIVSIINFNSYKVNPLINFLRCLIYLLSYVSNPKRYQ